MNNTILMGTAVWLPLAVAASSRGGGSEPRDPIVIPEGVVYWGVGVFLVFALAMIIYWWRTQ